MKILIAGFGSIGRRHFRNLVTLGERDILFLRSGRSNLIEAEISDYPVETDLRSALAHRPDAVIIANPTALHLDVAIQAANAGCHLFIEKPISHTSDRVDLLRKAIQHGGGKVFVGFQYRFHPGLLKVKQIISQGVLGHPLSVRAHWGEYLPGWHPWEDYRLGYSARKDLGGGVVLTLCHPLDYLRWLLGEVKSLWAILGKNIDLDIEVEDSAEIGLKFQRGIIGSVHLNYNQRPASHHLELVCSGGTIRWENERGVVSVFNARNESWKYYNPPPEFERNTMFLSEMEHFIKIVRGEEKSLCDFSDGLKSLMLTLAVYESSKKGKQVSME